MVWKEKGRKVEDMVWLVQCIVKGKEKGRKGWQRNRPDQPAQTTSHPQTIFLVNIIFIGVPNFFFKKGVPKIKMFKRIGVPKSDPQTIFLVNIIFIHELWPRGHL